MEYRETTRWFLKRLHQNEHLIVNIASETDISRSSRSVIPLNRASFQHISKRHCTISCVDGVATLTDRTSTSGTYVNDRKLCRETPGSVILQENDLVGIGAPCFQELPFYQQNCHVLLYRVCKDRNRVIREGDVDTILSSDEEADVTARCVPQEQLPNGPKLVEGTQYRILENIELSSDEEEVVLLNPGDRVTQLEEGILKETERKAKEIENQQKIKVELEELEREKEVRDEEARKADAKKKILEEMEQISKEIERREAELKQKEERERRQKEENKKRDKEAYDKRREDECKEAERKKKAEYEKKKEEAERKPLVENHQQKLQEAQSEAKQRQELEAQKQKDAEKQQPQTGRIEVKDDLLSADNAKLNDDKLTNTKESVINNKSKNHHKKERKRDRHKSHDKKEKHCKRKEHEKQEHHKRRDHKSTHSSRSSRGDKRKHDSRDDRSNSKHDKDQLNHHISKMDEEVIEVDQIEELFKDSLSFPSLEQSVIPIISIIDSESDDENDFSEKKYSQNYYRQIKEEALEVDLLNDEPELIEAVSSNAPVLEDSPHSFFSEASDTIYISEDDEDEQTLEDSKRWFMKLSQKVSPVRTKVLAVENSETKSNYSDTTSVLLQAAKRYNNNAPTSTNAITPLSTEINEIQSCFKLPLPKDHDSKSTSKDIPSTHENETNSVKSLSEEIRISSTKRKRKLPDQVPLSTAEEIIAQKDDKGEINLDDSFFSSILEFVENESHLPEQQADVPSDGSHGAKKQKISDTCAGEYQHSREQRRSVDAVSPASAASIAKAAGLKPTLSDAARSAMNEKNSNSASNSWIKRKIPFVEPHHIQKRRISTHNGSSSSKVPSVKKHSPSRKSDNGNEIRKEKLRAIQSAKPPSSERSTKCSKTVTIPKVKFTPSNRGAFLVQDIASSNQPNNEHESASTNGANEDLVCTQSTLLENLPVVENLIEEALTRAPKLTFTSVARVSSVSSTAPVFKIPKHRPPTVSKPPTSAGDAIHSLLDSIKEPVVMPTSVGNIASTNKSSDSTINSEGIRSILIMPDKPSKKRLNRVTWKENLSETRMFEIDDGNDLCVITKYYKEDNEGRNMSLASCQNDIILEITSWDAIWFDNPANAKICEGKLLPMVEQYNDFDDYKRIVMPILKTELFHDILAQYGEIKKTTQKPLQMKLNQIRAQSRTFVLNISVENSTHQSVNNKDYVLIIFDDKATGDELRVPAVVTTRRQLIQYAAENGLKFYHCTLETAKTPLSQRIRDGSGENFRIQSLTQINLHMRQFQVLFNLQNSPLLENILSPRSNFYGSSDSIDRRAYKGKEALNVQQGDILLSVFGQCLDLARPNIMLIHGPPGTGKSRLISNLVMQMHRGAPSNRRLKILVCAQSNTAVDVIVLKLIKLFRLLSKDEQSNILRTGTANKINHECRMVFLDDLARKQVNEQIKRRKLRDEDPVYETYYLERECLDRKIKYLQMHAQNGRVHDEIKQLQDKLNRVNQLLPDNVNEIDLHDNNRRHMEIAAKKQLVSKADIVCTTLGSCGGLMEYNQSLKFDVCIIDEATQCTEIASFTPLQYDVRKLILVGDIKQLPPFVFGKESAEAGLKNSLFARIQSSFIGTQLEGVKMLTTQYRMHPEIVKWPNSFFYDGKLSSDPEATKCDEFPFKPYTVFSLGYQQNQTQSEHHIYNNEEIQFVLKLLTEIMKFCERHITIAIITPYTRHKRECEKFLVNKKITQVSVLSIDSVQGQEFDVVIISLARSIGTGFLESPQRLNVALTRARKCLIMCGNFSELQATDVWSALLKDAEERKLLYHIEDDDEYDDVNSFVEKVMLNLRKNTPTQ
ncbi:uncharacterized protein LOC131694054 isoform X2 [Topomyia yanbarensis]|uniref:uncharacterized protein LOC131694054 isoform X2 n=1 Tax=Topomyia yanbarensis TaxID=2498891 RepID=UPI00273C9C1A|nr:uncharacterized protein LOC131694054 isoform X2 [Topomyia yanbarensis]